MRPELSCCAHCAATAIQLVGVSPLIEGLLAAREETATSSVVASERE